MGINPNVFVKLYIVIFILGIGYISYKVYEQVVFLQKQRKQLTHHFYDANLESKNEDSTQKKFKERKTNARKIMKIKELIKQINLKQKIFDGTIHNWSKFIKPKYIVVIQVHSNVYLFRQLLASLKSAYAISEALLIFSHDVFDPEINKAVHSVNFAKYMQIFYPYSTQLHPNVFPGIAPEGKDKDAIEQSEFRDPAAAQKKHHWWWQMNQLFDHLDITEKYNKPILFLEEDSYVTIDFLIVLNILQNVKMKECPSCEFISLGAHKPDKSLYSDNATITLEVWNKTMPNIGIAFDSSVWQSIHNMSHDFCYCNDFTWDNTLKYLGSKPMNTNYYLTAIDGPRVLRVETCDVLDFRCNPANKVRNVIDFTESILTSMFPLQLSVSLQFSDHFAVTPHGFFSDERDHELCMYFAKNNVWY